MNNESEVVETELLRELAELPLLVPGSSTSVFQAIRNIQERARRVIDYPNPVSTTPDECKRCNHAFCPVCAVTCCECATVNNYAAPASPLTVPELLLCPFCAEVPVADGNHWASVVHKATCWRTFIMESRVEHFHERAFAAWNTRFGRRLGATMIRDEVYHAALGELCDPDAGEVETNALALSIAEKVFDAIIERAQSAPTAQGEADRPRQIFDAGFSSKGEAGERKCNHPGAHTSWCNYGNPTPPAKGNWKCTNCDWFNFRENSVCNHCGTTTALSTTTAPTPVEDEKLREIRERLASIRSHGVDGTFDSEDHLSAAYREDVDHLLTRLSQREWRPIETCPTDRSAFLVWCPDRENIYEVYRFENDSIFRIFNSGGRSIAEIPTHWMPLPEPPEAAAAEGTSLS